MNFENICTPKEAEFLLENLKLTDNVLEYGSGEMALQIASKVKHVSVITHDLTQYGNIIDNKSENIEVLLVPTNIPQISDDGTLDEFKNYIEAANELAKRFGKFTVIIIRGRARVECAKFCKYIAKEDCKIFIQDYNHPNEQYRRAEYFEAEKHLTLQDGIFTLHKFCVNTSKPNEIAANNEPLSVEAFDITGTIIKPKTKKVTSLPPKEQKRVKSVAKEISKQPKKK